MIDQQTLQKSKTELAEKQNKIIDIVLELMLEKGHSDISMRAIAEKADMALPQLYRVFYSKDVMMEAAVCRVIEESSVLFFEDIAEEEDPWVRLAYYGINYIKFALANPTKFRFFASFFSRVFDEMNDVSSVTQNERDSHSNSNVYAFPMAVKDVVAECVDKGYIVGNSDVVFITLWSFVHGVSIMSLEVKSVKSWEEGEQNNEKTKENISDREITQYQFMNNIFDSFLFFGESLFAKDKIMKEQDRLKIGKKVYNFLEQYK